MEIHGRESPLRIVGRCGLDNICLSHISTTPGIGHCSQEQKIQRNHFVAKAEAKTVCHEDQEGIRGLPSTPPE